MIIFFNPETVQKIHNLVHFDQREKSHNVDLDTILEKQ